MFKGLVLPPGVNPQKLRLQRDQANNLTLNCDGRQYHVVYGETLATKAVYSYDAFGQLYLVGLMNEYLYCWPCMPTY